MCGVFIVYKVLKIVVFELKNGNKKTNGEIKNLLRLKNVLKIDINSLTLKKKREI